MDTHTQHLGHLEPSTSAVPALQSNDGPRKKPKAFCTFYTATYFDYRVKAKWNSRSGAKHTR